MTTLTQPPRSFARAVWSPPRAAGARLRRWPRATRSRSADALARLIDRDDPRRSRSRGNSCPMPQNSIINRGRCAIRSATTRTARSKASCIAIPTACCSSSTHVCAVYCRFCFRREMVGPGKPNALSAEALDARARLYPRHIRKSGKSSSPAATRWFCRARRLRAMMNALAAIDHVEDRAYSHPRAGRRSRAHHAASWCAR